MKTIEAVLVKFFMVLSVLFITLGLILGIEIKNLLMMSLILTLLLYAVDLALFKNTNNKIATISDFFLSLVSLYLILYFLNGASEFSSFLVVAFSSALLALGEYFYHIYLSKRVWKNKETSHSLKRAK